MKDIPFTADGVAVSPVPPVRKAVSYDPVRWTDWLCSRRVLLFGLSVIQLLLIPVCIICCAIDVETIVVTQAICLVALPLMLLGFRQSLAAWFGAAVVGLTLLCWILIPIMEWSPAQAQRPITALLFAAGFVLAPLGFVSIYEVVSRTSVFQTRANQFSLFSLMGAILVVSVFAGAARMSLVFGANLSLALAVAQAALIWGGTAAVLMVAFRHGRLSDERWRKMAETRRRFGQQVAKLRQQRALTEEQLAARCQWSAAYLRRMEAGSVNATLEDLAMLAEALNVSLAQVTDVK